MGKMSMVSVLSIIDRARKYIADGHVGECFDQLSIHLDSLETKIPSVLKIRNDLILLTCQFNQLENEKLRMEYGIHAATTNKIVNALLEIVEKLDTEISHLPTKQKSNTGNLHKVELVFDIDFESSTDEDIKAFLDRIAEILNTKPNELIIKAKKHGSVIIKTAVSTETLVKLKSLVKIGIIKDLKNIQKLGKEWEWLDKDSFVLFLQKTVLNKSDLYYTDLKLDNPREAFVNLSRADLINADLSYTDLSYTNLTEANLSYANLSYARLNGANLIMASLKGANLRNAYLFLANIRGADLREANLKRADLRAAYLKEAYLNEADLSMANLREANLSETDLSSARLNVTDMRKADLSGADLTRSLINGADLRGANLRGANLSRADLRDADLSWADFSDAYLIKSDFRGATLVNANLTRVKLIEANLKEAVFHIDQAPILEQMDVDISVVIFIDEEGNKVVSDVVV